MSDDNDLNNIQNIDICNNDVANYPNNKDSKTREELFHLKSQFYISDKSDNISTTIGQYCMYNIKQEIDIKESKKIDFFRVYTKEKKDAQRITKDGFLSNLIHGVDNTGNIKVWSSESMLLHIILNNIEVKKKFIGRSVLELGGGMSGLCGLGLAFTGLCGSLVITDGHPACVDNQKTCIQMNKQKYSDIHRLNQRNKDRKTCQKSSSIFHDKNYEISAHLLRWSKNDLFGDLNTILRYNCNIENNLNKENETINLKKFDIIIAADCLFFTDFHADFIWILKNSLVSEGYCFLLQPRRGGTLDLFIDRINIDGGFNVVCISDNYCDEINVMRESYQKDENLKLNKLYDEDIHYPILICLQLK
mmetsp:Transcript_6480/g.6627  ORF Transcript_6480/g.6627 Transcript_6480/m.6627 type:complete len:362 (+) Transcript_6480:3-1088(+)